MIILIITPIVIAAVPVVVPVLSADVLAVDPMMSEVRHVARDPNHFVAAVPIPWAMIVERPVADLD